MFTEACRCIYCGYPQALYLARDMWILYCLIFSKPQGASLMKVCIAVPLYAAWHRTKRTTGVCAALPQMLRATGLDP